MSQKNNDRKSVQTPGRVSLPLSGPQGCECNWLGPEIDRGGGYSAKFYGLGEPAVDWLCGHNPVFVHEAARCLRLLPHALHTTIIPFSSSKVKLGH